MLLFKRQVA